MTRNIAICIATYQRPEQLQATLNSLVPFNVDNDHVQVRIVDNDRTGSARAVVEQFQKVSGVDTHYVIEPEPNISCTRNCAVDMGPADLFAFIDDDEIAEFNWLANLIEAIDVTHADAVVGPVMACLADDAPPWMIRCGLFNKMVPAENEVLDWTSGRTSNALVKGKWFYEDNLRFDPSFGRSGGEDTALFAEIVKRGGCLYAASDAWVCEKIPMNRTNMQYLWQRRYRSGITFHRIASRNRGYHPAWQLCKRVINFFKQLITGIAGLATGHVEKIMNSLLYTGLMAGGLTAWRNPTYASSHIAYGKNAKKNSLKASQKNTLNASLKPISKTASDKESHK